MVDLFCPPKHKLYSLSLTFTFQVYGANKKNILALFPSTGNDAKMSVEFEGKQNTWLKVFFFVFLRTKLSKPEGA